MELWRGNLRVPFVYQGDAFYELMTVKDVLEHGWYLTNPHLGAPFGQESYDFPAHSGDSLHLVAIKALGIFSKDAVLVMNSYFLLCFPLIAIVSYLVLRRLGISVGVAIVIAVLFTVLPARFGNGELHLLLSAYFTVPVGCYLVLWQLEGRDLFKRSNRRRGPGTYVTWRSAAILGVCLALGSAGNYYALFTVAMMVMAAGLVFLACHRRRALICGLVAAMTVLAAVGLNGLPTFIYVAEHGRDTSVAQRNPAETADLGLALTQLVLPVGHHRIPALADLTERYLTSTEIPFPGETSFDTLGIISVLGLLYITVSLIACCVGGVDRGMRDRPAARAALGAGMAFLIGTAGGLDTLFAYVVDPQLRAPNRIAVFIAFFALYGVALALDRLRGLWQGRGAARFAFTMVLLGILVIGALDQTSPRMTPKYGLLTARYHSDAEFVHAIEQQVPANANIFQLPAVEFPEGTVPSGYIGAWDNAIGYLHSSHLHWSFGAMRGRPIDWQAALAHKPLTSMLLAISAAGFSGVYLDSYGYNNGGTELRYRLSRELGVSMVSPDGRLFFFNMAPYNRRLRQRYTRAQLASLAETTLHPAVE